ncbi:hypothetical protein [Cupriavidus sp. DF5525]|uniref:hypothetical protein n=1 Tax=Cupriavidus sp. DF5525 TaxID=3160989 RepID=UPI0003B04A19|nr:hypothetical protein N234_26115 [Ralstonia pickettii DTP0602]
MVVFPMVATLDPEGGIAFEASIFVAVLGASNYTYACATRAQTTINCGLELMQLIAKLNRKHNSGGSHQ